MLAKLARYMESLCSSEYSFNIAYAAPLTSKIQYGVNLKTVYSNYFQYFSTGLALDAGLSYVDTATLFRLV